MSRLVSVAVLVAGVAAFAACSNGEAVATIQIEPKPGDEVEYPTSLAELRSAASVVVVARLVQKSDTLPTGMGDADSDTTVFTMDVIGRISGSVPDRFDLATVFADVDGERVDELVINDDREVLLFLEPFRWGDEPRAEFAVVGSLRGAFVRQIGSDGPFESVVTAPNQVVDRVNLDDLATSKAALSAPPSTLCDAAGPAIDLIDGDAVIATEVVFLTRNCGYHADGVAMLDSSYRPAPAPVSSTRLSVEGLPETADIRVDVRPFDDAPSVALIRPTAQLGQNEDGSYRLDVDNAVCSLVTISWTTDAAQGQHVAALQPLSSAC